MIMVMQMITMVAPDVRLVSGKKAFWAGLPCLPGKSHLNKMIIMIMIMVVVMVVIMIIIIMMVMMTFISIMMKSITDALRHVIYLFVFD